MSHAAEPLSPRRPLEVDAGRLWAGGAATAVVAVLAVLVGYLVIDKILDIRLVPPPSLGLGWEPLVRFLVSAAVAALLATGLIHVLALSTPRPRAFFGWIVTLATVAAAAYPFTRDASMESKVSTAVLAVVVGIIIGSLVTATASRTIRPSGAVPAT